jgi:hypothetical protein
MFIERKKQNLTLRDKFVTGFVERMEKEHSDIPSQKQSFFQKNANIR